MLVVYQTTIINEVTYITGYYACAPDDPAGPVQLDSQLESVSSFYDDNGNPLWVLNTDGTVAQQPITLSQDQLDINTANASIATSEATITDLIPQILDYVISGDSIPQDLKDQWTNARSTITTATTSIQTAQANMSQSSS